MKETLVPQRAQLSHYYRRLFVGCLLIVAFVLAGNTLVFAERSDYYDLDKIDLKIIDIQILPMDDTPGYRPDDADLVKVTIRVVNNGLDFFVVNDKMFELWVMEPITKADKKSLKIVGNYDTSYDDEFEVRYEEMNSRELFEECNQTIERIEQGKSRTFTICYDILTIRNNENVKLDGTKKYYIVMMDNQQATSCPNCKKTMLTNDWDQTQYYIPKWVQNLLGWKKQGLVSEIEFQDSINYLVNKGIISEMGSKNKVITNSLAAKNQQLKKHQAILSDAYKKNLFVSSIQIFESKYSDVFTGVICKRQNDIITLDADYTSDNENYGTIFFKLIIYDNYGNEVASGLSKIVDVAPKSYRHLSISTPFVEDISYCLVDVDAKFP